MPYWSGDLDGSDFAFDSVGVIVLQTVKRLEEEADLVVEKHHPEQSIMSVLLKVLGLLMDRFPKCVAVHFRKRQYLAIKTGTSRGGRVVRRFLRNMSLNSTGM